MQQLATAVTQTGGPPGQVAQEVTLLGSCVHSWPCPHYRLAALCHRLPVRLSLILGCSELCHAAPCCPVLSRPGTCGTHRHSQEGIDAISDVIQHVETYDVTTIRASTPMFLMSRKIKALGVKMVLSGEGSDEVFGGYLYFHKAPNKVRRAEVKAQAAMVRLCMSVGEMVMAREQKIQRSNAWTRTPLPGHTPMVSTGLVPPSPSATRVHVEG